MKPRFHLSAMILALCGAGITLLFLGYKDASSSVSFWLVNPLNLFSICWTLHSSVTSRRKLEKWWKRFDEIRTSPEPWWVKNQQLRELRKELEEPS